MTDQEIRILAVETAKKEMREFAFVNSKDLEESLYNFAIKVREKELKENKGRY